MSSVAAQHSIQPTDFHGATHEALGTLAHELRQPLSNIEAIAYYLGMILPPGDVKVQAQLTRIRELVEQSNWILSSALSLGQSFPAAPRPDHLPNIALEELVTEAVASCGAPPAGIRLELGGDVPLVHLDPRAGRDLVDSLLMLFRTISDGADPVTLRTSAGSGCGALLELHASGNCANGVPGAGSELALESVRRIAAAHGGTFTLDAGGPTGGIHGRLMLP